MLLFYYFYNIYNSPQGRDDADEEDRLSALLLQRLLLLLRHLGDRVRHRAARAQQGHHPAPHLHHRLLLHGAAHDADPPAAGLHPDVVRHAGAGQEDRGGSRSGRHARRPPLGNADGSVVGSVVPSRSS